MFVNVHYFLWITVGILFSGIVASYTIAVSLGHVYFCFPFISDTGAEPPENGVFGFTLNITTVMLVANMYLRYKQVACVKEKIGLPMSACWNKTAMVFGGISCFGLNMVANFNEMTEGLIHLMGAFTCFTMATIYFIIQTKISYHFINHTSEFRIRISMFIMRCVLCLVMIVCYFLTLWFGKAALDEFTGDKLNYWRQEDGGFNYRLISTFSEWITMICFTSYILTFSHEFQKIECGSVTVVLKTSKI